jgi:SAM-dependent methyltransferase
MTSQAPSYMHGHHESVLRSHTWRTAQNSAAYLLPLLRTGMRLLDVGCGPGTITIDLAGLVAPGEVIGVDATEEPLEGARRSAAGQGVANVRFETGDAFSLRFENASFDVVHAHQLLQHVAQPVAALTEFRRVARPSGIVAVRDFDARATAWYPELRLLDRWEALYQEVARASGGEPNAGRRLLAWAHAAGFVDVTASASTWCYATPADRAWWGGLWSDRVTSSTFAETALSRGLASREELEDIAGAWREWAIHEDGWIVLVHGEIVCRVH